jgi:hypothetical protein
LGLDVLDKVSMINTLYTAHRSDRHKDRCIYVSVVGMQNPSAGCRMGIRMLDYKFHLTKISKIEEKELNLQNN